MEHSRESHSWPVTLVAPSRRPFMVCVVWYLVLIGIRFIPGVDRHLNLFMTFAVLSSIAATIGMGALGRGKVSVLRVLPDRVVVGPHVLPRAGLDAQFAVWKEPYAHTTSGSALCLRVGRQSVRVGGRDSLASSAAEHRVVDRVDASLKSDDFLAFMRALSLSEAAITSAKRGQIAVDLVPSTLTVRGQLRVMSSWIATVAVLGCIGVIAGAFHFERSPRAVFAVEALMVVVVLGGVVLTFRRQSKPPRTRFRLLIEPRQVVLEDTRSRAGRPTTFGPPLRAERHFYRSTGRYGSADYATVRIHWSSGRSDVIGVMNSNWRWPAPAPRLRKLHYLIGDEEWRRLIAALRIPVDSNS